MCKRILSLVLCFFVFSFSVLAPCERVMALTGDDVDNAFQEIIDRFDGALESDGAQKIEELMLSDSFLFNFVGSVAVPALKFAEAGKGLVEKIRDSDFIKDFKRLLDFVPGASEGDYTVNPKFMEGVYAITQDYIESGGDDFFIMKAHNYPDGKNYLADFSEYVNYSKISASQYNNALNYITTHSDYPFGFHRGYGSVLDYSFYNFYTYYYYYVGSNGSSLYYYDPVTGETKSSRYNGTRVLNYSIEGIALIDYSIGNYTSYCGAPMRVFYSFSSLLNYLREDRPYYYASDFYDYDINKQITIDKSTINYINNTDYETVNNNIYNQITEQIKSEGAITEKDIQKIVDSILNTISSIPDNSGSDSSGSGSSSDDSSDSSGTGSDSGSDDSNDSGDSSIGEEVVNEIIDLLKISNERLEEIIKGVEKTNKKLDSLIETVEDLDVEIEERGGMGLFVKELFGKFEEVADTSKDKFPTSIPWDIILIVNRFKAEPEVPNFEIPFVIKSFGVNEKITINLKDFEKVSKTSRSILSLTFCMFLLGVTRKMFFRDE